MQTLNDVFEESVKTCIVSMLGYFFAVCSPEEAVRHSRNSKIITIPLLFMLYLPNMVCFYSFCPLSMF